MNVAFLQNQWFTNPDRVRATYASAEKRQGKDYAEKVRQRMIRYALFAGCLTGRRIEAAFGEGVIDAIRWEEASREIGGKPSSVFPPDIKHICRVIEEEQPELVLTFGKVAWQGVNLALNQSHYRCVLIRGPHPAARHGTVVQELECMAAEYDIRITKGMFT